jgi:GT2 family glycosyltransferase
LRRNPGFVGSNIAVDRAAFLSIGGFDGALRANEDIDLALRLIAADVVITRVKGAIAQYDSEHGGPRLTGWWNLTATKYKLARKHLKSLFASLLVSTEYGVRLLVSAMLRVRPTFTGHRQGRTNSAPRGPE